MKRIALLVCGLVLVVANTAEARRQRWSNYQTYTQPVASTPTTYSPQVAYKLPVADTAQATDSAQAVDKDADAAVSSATSSAAAVAVTTAAATTTAPVTTAPVTAAAYTTAATTARSTSYSTSTAQGVANLMASYNRVGHFGGNPGYEGCGCGATPAAAYSICCYGNSGMATVDVGYAQGANGLWYCCRRYR